MGRLKKIKNILITGAASGIGKEVSYFLSKKNYRIISIDKDKNKNTKNLINFQCDLADLSSLENTIRDILSKYKKIDCIINNARLNSKKKVLNENINDWCNQINVNLTSHFFITQEIIKKKTQKDTLIILNISSIASNLITKETCSYHVSKAGLEQMGRFFAYHGVKRKIKVYNLKLGFIAQKRYKKKIFSLKNKIYLNKINLYQNSGKVIQVGDLQETILFLLKNNNSILTGNTFYLDGGASLVEPFYLLNKK